MFNLIKQVVFLVILLCLGLSLRAQIPAFPGAEGFGAYATGGRGGDVYTVTNLNNSGSGTLREALDTAPSSGRTIVFAVSGYIPVNSDTNFQVPANVTIAGQTAPGDGIGLKGGRMLIKGNNTVMRHFRIRHGKYGTGGDCLNIAEGIEDTIVDHLSLMFSTDENFSFFGNVPDNFTMQYTSTSWGMERHNAGGLWDLNQGTCHHSLWAHHTTRNPKARPSMLEWVNNVTFDYGTGFIMGDSQTPMDWKANVIGCYYLSIPSYRFGLQSKGLTKAYIASDGQPNFSLYLNDCLYDYNNDGLLNGTDRGYDIVEGQAYPDAGTNPGTKSYYKSLSPFAGAPATVTVDDPLTAYKKVVSSVGPLRLNASSSSLRDELDTLLIESVENQECIMVAKDSPVADGAPPSNGEQLLADQYGISNSGFGTLNSTVASEDSDGDGMPDNWEMALGSNIDVQDHNTAFGNDGSVITATTFFPAGTPAGYTYLEEYLHYCAIPHAEIDKNTNTQPTFINIDLSRYTRGFTNNPEFTINGAYQGSIYQFDDDGVTPSSTGSMVVYIPNEGYYGRAGIHFTVNDDDGSSWTQFFAILVTTDHVDDGPPAAPKKLSAVQGDSVIWLNWYDNIEPDIASYNVWRSNIQGGSFISVATDLTVSTFVDNSVVNGTEYYYVVTAVDIDGNESSYSIESSATPSTDPDDVAPSTPTNLTVVSGGGQIILDWDDNTEADLNGYNVKRSTTSEGSYSTVATLVSASNYTDDGVTSGATYYYVVTAVDISSNESAISNESSGTAEGMSYAVNSGGGEEIPFVADAYYSGGGTYTKVETIDFSGVTDAAPEAVYQCERHGDFSYTFPGLVAGANYIVRLHFAEIYHTSTGSRIFNVAINGVDILTNYDILSITGARYKAHIEEFRVSGDSNGDIIVEFSTVVDNSLVCGIEVIYAGIPDPSGGQSEEAFYGNGAIFEDKNSGFNGTGYVNFPTSGGYLEYGGIDGGSGGDALLDIRYALNDSSGRTGNLIVNGVSQSIAFDSTSAWNTWAIKNLTVALNSGTFNTIRFESNGDDLANIDEIMVMPLAPKFTTDPISNLDGIELANYTGTPLADFADCPQGIDTVKFSKDSGPNWLVVSSDGLLSGIPYDRHIGSNTFTVRVTDTGGLFDTAQMDINIANVYSGVRGLEDLSGLIAQWMESGCVDTPSCDGASLDGDDGVDMSDYGIFSENWLKDESLQLYLKFDESGDSIIDSSIYDRSCQPLNDPVKVSAGYSGSAINFDGADDYIEIENYTGISGSGPRTVAAWIKAEEDQANADKSIHALASWGKAEPGEKFLLMLDNITGQLALATYSGRLLGGPDLEDGFWHHISVVLPAGSSNLNQVKLYVDGQEVSTNAASLDSAINTSSTENLIIGAVDIDILEGIQAPVYSFKGVMDEVRIYDSSLSDIEISELAIQ